MVLPKAVLFPDGRISLPTASLFTILLIDFCHRLSGTFLVPGLLPLHIDSCFSCSARSLCALERLPLFILCLLPVDSLAIQDNHKTVCPIPIFKLIHTFFLIHFDTLRLYLYGTFQKVNLIEKEQSLYAPNPCTPRYEQLRQVSIIDTVHEMARDEARHGKALKGLLERYFK